MQKAFGYARVSTDDQNEGRQVEALLRLGIAERDIFIDKQSGKNFERAQYQILKGILREGDILYVKSLDRFGRDKDKILEEWREITKTIKADIVVLDMPLLDTTRYKDVKGLEGLIADIVLQLLAYFAEEERLRIRQRQREGIELAKAHGKYLGRPIILKPEGFGRVAARVLQGEITSVQAMKELQLNRCTYYKFLNQYKEQLKIFDSPSCLCYSVKNSEEGGGSKGL